MMSRRIRQALVLFVIAWVPANAVAAERVPWVSSQVRGTPTPPPRYRVEQVFGQHKFDQPVTLTSAPGTDSMFLLELPGPIYELSADDAEPTLIADLAKHVDDCEACYGLAFHPRFQSNREIYVCYTRGGDRKIGTVVSRFRLTTSSPMRIEPDSEEIVYTWLAGGHNGGCVKFGPDGFLYVSAGDSAGPFPPDPLRAGQDLTNLLSTIVRIDVDRTDGDLRYAIPADNPFVDVEGARGEIWAYGLRNPWRMAFDQKTGDLWVGDVGWELWEMIHCVQSGGNYGWSLVEGPHDIHPDANRGPTRVIKPAAVHSHSESRSITGGQVYYGERFPELQGAYVYGDHVTGLIWSIRKDGETYTAPTEIARSALHIICFGLDNNGEVYIVDWGGTIHRLVNNESATSNENFPRTLAASGLFASTEDHALAPGVLSYSVIAEPWMDGASATRFIGIPNDGCIGVYGPTESQAKWNGQHEGGWKFPRNTVLGKTISLKNRRIETQLLHFDGQAWQPYTYIWNDRQTDASLASDVSQPIEVGGDNKQQWSISNRTDCMVCHSSTAGMVLGFKPNQLRRPVDGSADQLEQFHSLGLFEQAPPEQSQNLVDPYNDNADLTDRARAYLQVNCSHCHRRNGGGAVPMDVLLSQPLKKTRLIGEPPTQGTFDIADARVITAGDPFRSVLFYRFCKLGSGRMPRLGGTEVDHAGANLFYDWIVSLGDAGSDADQQQSAIVDSLRHAAMGGNPGLVEFLSDTRRSLTTVQAIRSGLVDSTLRDKVLAVSQELPVHIVDLFEPFMPAEMRTERMGNNLSVQAILARAGDAERGRRLFQSASMTCKNCHAVERDGKGSAGPNLASLPETQYARETLLKNILEPSLQINDEYKTHLVVTVDGEVLTGVIKMDGDTIVLVDAQNKVSRIEKRDVESQKPLPISIMPEKLLNSLTLEQAVDLLEYLVSLKPER